VIRSIQILRAIAALSVVFTHYNFLHFKVGGFGVDIFFIISGFIITYMVNKDSAAFLYKRALRIIPLYYLMTFAAVALAMIRPDWFLHESINGSAVVKSLCFIPYTENGGGPILSLGWSLNYEIFFYLLMYVCIRLFSPEKRVWMCMLILLCIFLIIHFLNPQNYMLAFYGRSIILEFILGSLLYYFWKNYHPIIKKKPFVKNICIGIGMLSYGVLIYMDYLDLPYNRFLHLGVPALLFVNGFLLLEDKIRQENILHRFFLRLGDASYVIYLLHLYVIFACIRVIYPMIPVQNIFLSIFELVFAFGVVCYLSIAIHQKIEMPIIQKIKSIFDSIFLKKIKSE